MRWRTAVAVAALVAAGAGLWVLLSGGPSRAPRRRLASIAPIAIRPPQAENVGSSRLAAAMGAGNAEIRRLAGLELPVFCGGPRGRDVAFTFDDGPGVYTHLALKKLRQAHERATFFVVGKSINSWPGYLRPELRLGAIGDHTYTHLDLVTLPAALVTFQLARTAQMIRAQSGELVDLWRPPYGAYDASVKAIAKRLGLLEILWSIDSGDSLGANWAKIIRTVEGQVRPGSIVLFHENRGQTIRALTTLLPWLRRHHLRSVSVPELLAADPPSMHQLRQGLSGCGANARLLAGVG
jgi:peptidoglycan/xylan/chitin deacetylase (PgdA/CDA1 family)